MGVAISRPGLAAPLLANQSIWHPATDPGIILLARAPDFLELRQPGAIGPLGGRESPEGLHAFHPAAETSVLILKEMDPTASLMALIPIDVDAVDRLDALRRFWAALQGRPIPRDGRLTDQQRPRMRRSLQAVDGREQAATYRDIAIAIFGYDRVASEPWKTSSVRQTVIELVRYGYAMIAGGYRAILRSRRRS